MRIASDHQRKVKMSGSEKKMNENTYDISSKKRVTKKFMEVSRRSRAKQWQRNVQKKCAARANIRHKIKLTTAKQQRATQFLYQTLKLSFVRGRGGGEYRNVNLPSPYFFGPFLSPPYYVPPRPGPSFVIFLQ